MRHDGARPGDVSLELSELRQPPPAAAVQGTLRAVRVLHRLLRHGGLTPRCLLLALLLLVACRPPVPRVAEASTASCLPVGSWVDPATRRIVQPATVLARAAAARVVLLGEHHGRADHHRWQLQVLAALQAARPDLVLGLEMFPRRTQPALDRWVAGGVPAPAFLVESDWTTVWGYPAAFYLPLFEFARMNRVPMQALNVDRGLAARVDAEGWAAIPQSEREGITDPRPLHRRIAPRSTRRSAPTPARPTSRGRWTGSSRRSCCGTAPWPRRSPAFCASGRTRSSSASWAADICGRAGACPTSSTRSGSATWSSSCRGMRRATVPSCTPTWRPPSSASPRPSDAEPAPLRLGVQLAAADGGVRVTDVVAGSVAAAAGLRAGDVIERAASVPVATPDALRTVVERQAPGTWLPLEVRRGREKRTRTVVARFGSVR